MFLTKLLEIRKIQKSPTGFYLNFPKRIADQLELKGGESFKIIMDQTGKVTMEKMKL